VAKNNTTLPAASDASKKADQLLAALADEYTAKVTADSTWALRNLDDHASGKTLLAQDRVTQAVVASVALDRLKVLEKELEAIRRKEKEGEIPYPSADPDWGRLSQQLGPLRTALDGLLRRSLPFGELDAVRLLEWPGNSADWITKYSYPLAGITNAAESFAESNTPSERFKTALSTLIHRLRMPNCDKECRKYADRLQALLSGGPQIHLEPGEAWSDAALADPGRMRGKARQAWDALLLHCQSGGRGKYSERWRTEAEPLLNAIGFDSLKEHLLRWFPLVDKPRTQPIPHQNQWQPDYDQLIKDPHVELLRGLAWCCGLREDAELARALARLALSAYRKIPGKGPRLVSLGNACVTALGLMPGRAPIGQLAVLKVKVKFGTAQKEIEKSFHTAAVREGLPADEIEELAVPSYGLEEVGHLRASFGEYQAEVSIDGSSAGLHWFKGDRPVKSAPTAVRSQHKEEYRELQGTLKDVNAMLPAQRERIDALFLSRKSWPLAAWRERYLDHPLVGTIARRLVWTFTAKGKVADGIWHGGGLVGRNGKPLNLKGEPTVSLWHPIDRPTDEVLAWRDWLEKREVVQPFKQAHREVYVLTDAERRTRTYSNRFAAHVLKQHQFNALCAARGWKNQLRLMVDSSYPPASRPLPAWGLRAEYWVEGAGDQYGQDTNDSGTYLYLTTDQVRFYALDAPQLHAHATGGGYGRWGRETDEPLALEAVPPLVFSEIMRDVDLFVGVASVGNDPNWADGGPGGRYRDYWQHYSFGELSATARTRRTLLERLLPRLKIADRCTLSERFLHVRGDLRGYKIHLGSGNILMTPNDQYLCIVPKQTTAGHERVFLPFEGDNTLSVILSKAFLLAEDTNITDSSITSQLKR
jgi:hypothetical protein